MTTPGCGTADVVAAASIEALLGTDRPFAERVHALRPHPGQLASSANLRRLLARSEIVSSHRESHHAVQDAYSLRCTPQVHGACRDLLGFAEGVFDRELASITDNPLVFADTGEVVSAGNFHGEPLAFAHDMLAIAMAELGSISERRVNRLLDPEHSRGLPPFLAAPAGNNSGLMLAQYTAAALVTELRLNAQPASIHSISTSAEQEDHVSMGWTAARKAMQAGRALRSTASASSCSPPARGSSCGPRFDPGPAPRRSFRSWSGRRVARAGRRPGALTPTSAATRAGRAAGGAGGRGDAVGAVG